jgi:hypothetical protein
MGVCLHTPCALPRSRRTPSDKSPPLPLMALMNRADLRAWLRQAALDVARLAEPRGGDHHVTSDDLRAWQAAGIAAQDVALWQSAGCAVPSAARQMEDVGIRPQHLVRGRCDDRRHARPAWRPIAADLADGEITADQAANLIAGWTLLQWRAEQRRAYSQEPAR